MDAWPGLVSAALQRHGVADVAMAGALGVPASRFYRRTTAESWDAPAPGVRVHPAAGRSVQRDILVLSGATRHPLAASDHTAAWLHGLRPYPPDVSSVVVGHGTRGPQGRARVQRCRWLSNTDIVLIDHVPTLDLPAFFIACVGPGSVASDQLWAWLIAAVHRRARQADLILDRLDQVGPVHGRAELRRRCQDLARVRIESIFQDDVAQELARRGYRPERSTKRIGTPDGIGLQIDIALLAWQVAVEPDGDAFHRTREQRRADRRRDAAFAGTDWVRVPIDWRDWHLDRGHVLAAIDAAIEAQQRRGIGTTCAAPQSSRSFDPVGGTRVPSVATGAERRSSASPSTHNQAGQPIRTMRDAGPGGYLRCLPLSA